MDEHKNLPFSSIAFSKESFQKQPKKFSFLNKFKKKKSGKNQTAEGFEVIVEDDLAAESPFIHHTHDQQSARKEENHPVTELLSISSMDNI